ncbi:MAG: phenylacetate-CoA oxygenase subunit PaaJ [Bacteroidia bacterium]|jgi:ring-1,2-phenylacetyl-CoA epoxidase subunit PaaD|nr:phenylacetate-CoA oxygenase subunit PaaJ [Bacteroidia bacterium]MDG2041283.1 phenylacetate-CoA oxygenase subunit PaaJ [Bacteroidia bacterium]|tara:strand:+ start:4179 stop:4661 length:483 start_codon:yes stop_codon:yes gene_type:complete
MISEAYIREELKQVKDPEIPTISIVDLGIVTGIDINDKNVHVTLTPTFAGCPALRLMEDMVVNHLNANSKLGEITVETSFETTWTTDLITPEGHIAIKKHGLAPPKRSCSTISMEILESTKCPYCDSGDTSMKSPFGPTLCRSLHYCNNCKQAFEGFKPI